MKKKIFYVLIIAILFLFISTNDVYGYRFGDITMSLINAATGVVEVVTDPIGTVLSQIGNWLIDNLITGVGDFFQGAINGLQTYTLSVPGGFTTTTYSEDEVKKNKDINKYVNLNGSYSKKLTNYKEPSYKITMKNSNQGLDADSEIPFVVVDFYSLIAGKVAFTDINFLTVDKTIHNNTSGSFDFWELLRKIASSLIRVTIYLSAAALITALIFHGIVVVGNVYNPGKRAQHQEGFNRFIKAVLMLVGSILAMALMIFFSRMMVRAVLSDTGLNEFPIQVTAEEANRTFSTNITGYYRYKAQITENLSEKFACALVYAFLAVCNFLLGILMIGRFLAIIVLSVWGIALAAFYMWRNESVNGTFINWGIAYGAITMFPLLIAVIELVMLKICCR